jgi:integrase
MRDALNRIAEALGVPAHLRVGPAPYSADASSAARRRRTGQENVTYLYCDWSALRSADVRAIKEWLTAPSQLAEASPARYAPATVNRMLAALRGVLSEARRLGLVRDEDCPAADLRALSAAGGPPIPPRGRSLSRGELTALLACCRGDEAYYRRFPRRLPHDTRDAALIAMLYGVGLRRCEIVALDLDDYDRERGTVRIRSARAGRERILSVRAAGAMRYVRYVQDMRDWLALRGDSPGPLFCSIPKSGLITGRRLSDQAIYHILRVRQRQARLAPFSPGDLRRSGTGCG